MGLVCHNGKIAEHLIFPVFSQKTTVTSIYKKPIHTNQHHNYHSNHSETDIGLVEGKKYEAETRWKVRK